MPRGGRGLEAETVAMIRDAGSANAALSREFSEAQASEISRDKLLADNVSALAGSLQAVKGDVAGLRAAVDGLSAELRTTVAAMDRDVKESLREMSKGMAKKLTLVIDLVGVLSDQVAGHPPGQGGPTPGAGTAQLPPLAPPSSGRH